MTKDSAFNVSFPTASDGRASTVAAFINTLSAPLLEALKEPETDENQDLLAYYFGKKSGCLQEKEIDQETLSFFLFAQQQLQQRIQHAFTQLLYYAENAKPYELSAIDGFKYPDQLGAALEKSHTITREYENDEVSLFKAIKNSPNLAHFLGFLADDLLAIFAIARHLFMQEKVEEALSLYTLLVLLAPQLDESWYSLALCHQKKAEWQHALVYLETSAALDIANPAPHYQMAVCYCQLNSHHEAQIHIDQAIALSQEDHSGPDTAESAYRGWLTLCQHYKQEHLL